MSCDLHIHSTCSDGAVPIERLASIAARTGLHAIALSDHDTLLSAQYAYAHTGQDGVELIPAVELTGYDFERQHRVHLLCYYPDVDCPALREHCAIMKERRNACALQSAKELEQLYPQFTTDLAWETTKASGVLFKSGLMQALELLGLTDGSIYGETYHKLFGWNPRGIVLHSPEYLPVRQVLATAKASGGAVVFAHPTVYKSMPLLRELAAEGAVDGIEVYHPSNSPEDSAECLALCKQYGLDPVQDGVIIGHAEGHRRGVASNHADPELLWQQYRTGCTMDGFRRDVAEAMAKEDREEVPDMPRYDSVAEMPQWARADAQRLIDRGALQGNTDGKLDVSEDMLRTMIVCQRMVDEQKET